MYIDHNNEKSSEVNKKSLQTLTNAVIETKTM